MQTKQNNTSTRQHDGKVHMSLLNNMQNYFRLKIYKKLNSHFFNVYSLIESEDQDRKWFSQKFQQMAEQKNFHPSELNLPPRESRGIASMLGMAICDALGACTQFEEYNAKGYDYIKNGFKDIPQLVKKGDLRRRSGETTIWTDDASMGLAMAFSLLLKDYKLDPTHIRYMFILWWHHGLGNGGRDHSIGLGGNISISMDQFMNNQVDFAQTGNQFNNGNGSLMRLAPIPVAFSDNIKQAMDYAEKSSLTTHNGIQAKQCCRLLTAIIVELINRQDKEDEQKQEENCNQYNTQKPQQKKEKFSTQKKTASKKLPKWKLLIEKVCNEFKSESQSVMFLAQSTRQSEDLYESSAKKNKTFKKFNPDIQDRNWNWKSKDFTYSKTRNNQQPGYIGSYCMDALAMALHTVWHTNSFKECALKNTNMGGDCDSVGSIAGQIAGAAYGIDSQMLELYSEMNDFTKKRYEVFLLGYKLINKKTLSGKSLRKNVENKPQKMEIQ